MTLAVSDAVRLVWAPGSRTPPLGLTWTQFEVGAISDHWTVEAPELVSAMALLVGAKGPLWAPTLIRSFVEVNFIAGSGHL